MSDISTDSRVAAAPAAPDKDSLTFAIGHDIIGPVFQRWLIGLDQFTAFFADDGDTRFLFCSRAGVRIKRLFDRYLDRRERPAGAEQTMFWISRLSVCKGLFRRLPEDVATQIAREYSGLSIAALVQGLLRHQPDLLASIPLGAAEEDRDGAGFTAWLAENSPAALDLKAYLNGCGEDFDAYVAQLMGGARRAVLIDSGWGGTVQTLLAAAYPEYDWKGLYFGQTFLPFHNQRHADSTIGLLFQNAGYMPGTPASAIAECRHLIETILEPNGPSIEEIPFGRHDAVAGAQITANLAERIDGAEDALYLAVSAYLDDNPDTSLAIAFARYQTAIVALERLLLAPTREEARALICKGRSADFGKSLVVPILVDGEVAEIGLAERLARSLWPQGQIALDHAPHTARVLQTTMARRDSLNAYFDPASIAPGEVADRLRLREERQARVAIITRTKDRPLLLRRAAASVAAQTYANYMWVVVNDGGDEAVVRDVIEACAVDRRRILLVSNPVSRGMEAASNIGITNSASDYVVIHDDDDSWEPTFLARTAAFLSSPAGRRYGGVITKTVQIDEEIDGTRIHEQARRPFLYEMHSIHMAELAHQNLFPPIAFLFRRAVWHRIGGYDESLPVLGDWFFNLEFLLDDDIYVLPEALAFYHHRHPGAAVGFYANSVYGAMTTHREFNAVMRNRFARKHSGTPMAQVVLSAILVRPAWSENDRSDDIPSPSSFVDLADRRWVLNVVNLHLARSIAAGHGDVGTADLLDEAADWATILDRLGTLQIPLPIPSDFDEEGYAAIHADIGAALASGALLSSYRHYVAHGRTEGRTRTEPATRW